MKILVTGASGQLGSYTIEALARKHDVTGIDRKPCNIEGIGDLIVKGDIKDYELMMRLLKDTDAVVHTAAQVSVERSLTDPEYDATENILGTLNVLETGTKSLVKHVVNISSAAIFGPPVKVPLDEAHPTQPISPYGVSKLAAENYCFAFAECYGLDVTSIRPFNIYSPRQDPKSPYSGVITKFVERLAEDESPVIQGDGLQTRDFVAAADVVGMIELCLDNEKARGQTFNCGTGNAISIKELAEVLIELSGKDVEIEHAAARAGDIRHSSADISKARELLGYRPAVELKEGLSELLA